MLRDGKGGSSPGDWLPGRRHGSRSGVEYGHSVAPVGQDPRGRRCCGGSSANLGPCGKQRALGWPPGLAGVQLAQWWLWRLWRELRWRGSIFLYGGVPSYYYPPPRFTTIRRLNPITLRRSLTIPRRQTITALNSGCSSVFHFAEPVAGGCAAVTPNSRDAASRGARGAEPIAPAGLDWLAVNAEISQHE
jgi:hypothetical protein